MTWFRSILAGVTGFPPPASMSYRERRKHPLMQEDLNIGRRVYRDPERQEKCFNCRLADAVIFVYAPATSQLPSRDSGYCEPCWRSYPTAEPPENIK